MWKSSWVCRKKNWWSNHDKSGKLKSITLQVWTNFKADEENVIKILSKILKFEYINSCLSIFRQWYMLLGPQIVYLCVFKQPQVEMFLKKTSSVFNGKIWIFWIEANFKWLQILKYAPLSCIFTHDYNFPSLQNSYLP